MRSVFFFCAHAVTAKNIMNRRTAEERIERLFFITVICQRTYKLREALASLPQPKKLMRDLHLDGLHIFTGSELVVICACRNEAARIIAAVPVHLVHAGGKSLSGDKRAN